MPIAFLAIALVVQAPLAAAPPQPGKPRKVCREEERRTGSHIRPGRICKTQEQWLIEDEARDRIPVTLQVKGEEVRDRPQ